MRFIRVQLGENLFYYAKGSTSDSCKQNKPDRKNWIMFLSQKQNEITRDAFYESIYSVV